MTHSNAPTRRPSSISRRSRRRSKPSPLGFRSRDPHGSATAITHIFPDLKGKLNGHAVRVPLANASLTDCVFEVSQKTSVDEVNALLESASQSDLKGILGYESQPLVSIDYRTDPRSSIVDALSTMVINDTQVKLYLWYDNEWGYANRTAELAQLVGRGDLP